VIGIFFNSLLISLTAVVVFCFSLEIFRSKKIASVLSLIFGVCSIVWPYNTVFWTQPLQALTLIASAFYFSESLYYNSSFICHYTRPDKNKVVYFAGLGGLLLGLSVLAHPTSIVIVPGFIAYCAFSMHRITIRVLVSFIVILGITLFFYGSHLHDIWFLY
jgi:4-amino-4-deoxy-L-arabinose transferase-like glycosyltransferase